jgi:hypothetical protein
MCAEFANAANCCVFSADIRHPFRAYKDRGFYHGWLTLQYSRCLPDTAFPVLWEQWKYISPEEEARLTQIATRSGTDSAHVVKDAALRLLEDKTPAL